MIINFILKNSLEKGGKYHGCYLCTLSKKAKRLFRVPEVIKEKVKQILIDLEVPELAE